MDKNEYLQLIHYMQELYKIHKDKCRQEFEGAEKTVVQEEYCSKSDLCRGYYCPSPVEDLVIGNTHRGRIAKRKPKEPPAYQYGFDEQNRLVTVKEKFCDEVILYDDNEEIGIQYGREDNEIRRILLCKYQNGRISMYAYAFFIYGKTVSDFYLQTYRYFHNVLWVDMYGAYLLFREGKGSLKFERYVFRNERWRLFEISSRRIPG